MSDFADFDEKNNTCLRCEKPWSERHDVLGRCPDVEDSTVQPSQDDNDTPDRLKCKETVYLTPDEVLDPMRDYWGGSIPFDAATLPSNPTKADRFLTKEDDGLVTPWEPRTFVNPPFGKGMSAWTEKIALEAAMGHELIVVLPMGTRYATNYWQNDILSPCLNAICFVKGRVAFKDIDGKPHKNNIHDSAIYAYNVDVRRFCAHLGHLGKILRVGGLYYRPAKHPMKAHLAERYAATYPGQPES